MKDKEKDASPLFFKETSRRSFLKGVAIAAGGTLATAAIGVRPGEVRAADAPKPVQRYLFAERRNCTGCRACEYACSVSRLGVVRPSVSRIHIYRHKRIVDIPVICWHCEDTPCVFACPNTPGSLSVDPNSNGIIHDPNTCSGESCLKCRDACPARYVRVHPDTGQPLMCDMCGGEPECVKACFRQSGNPQGPCLMANASGFGVNRAYRNVTPAQAGEDMLSMLFYPGTGKRISGNGGDSL
jgi:Fe-S-cluster-containing hydrogenase component 2